MIGVWDLPGDYIGNLNLTGYNTRINTWIFLYRSRTVLSLLDILTCLSSSWASTMKDPLSGNLWWKRVKKAWQRICFMRQRRAYSRCTARPLQLDAYQLHVRVTFHLTTSLSACEMKLHSERGSKNRVCACNVVWYLGLHIDIYRVH